MTTTAEQGNRPSEPGSGPLLKVRGLVKRYGNVNVLTDVDFAATRGRVHALLGANGAGKSTLVKIITGLESADQGLVDFDGFPVAKLTPSAALKLGISLVPQERHICHELTVAENVLLAQLPARRGIVRWARLREKASAALEGLGFHHLDIDRPAGELAISDWQIIEIARALVNESRLIILDEPTTALSISEATTLQGVIGRVSLLGVAVVYISHVLDEVFSVADEVTILRDGRVVHHGDVEHLDRSEVTRHMLGDDVARQIEQRPTRPTDVAPILSVAAVSDRKRVLGASLRISAGEIVCLVGDNGSGRQELSRMICGVDGRTGGEISVRGRAITNVRSALAAGVAHVPDDRGTKGLLLDLDIGSNLSLGRLTSTRGLWVSPRGEADVHRSLISTLGIKGAQDGQPVRRLSGGNQQKVLLGRWIGLGAVLYVLEDPTVGVDIAARWDIYRLLRDLAEEGAAILLSTADHEEVTLCADRAVVMRSGRVIGELIGEAIEPARLLALEMGADA
jgi:ABC-type sugar transport system ATPase subunit